MNKNRAVSVSDFAELRFKPGTWAAKGFPEQGCWIRITTLERIIDEGGDLDIQDVIADLLDFLPIAPDRDEVWTTLSLIAHRHAAALRRSYSEQTSANRLGKPKAASRIPTHKRH